MSVTRWSPASEMESIREMFNRLATEFDGWPRDWHATEMMPVDVQELDEHVIVKASMPGIDQEHVEIDLRDSYLHIKGTNTEERDETRGTWHRKERRFDALERSVRLPCPVATKDAQAKLRDGVLEIRLRKEKATPSTRIEVKS